MGVEKFSRHLVDLEDGGDEAGFVCGFLFGQADHLELGVFLGGFEIGEGFWWFVGGESDWGFGFFWFLGRFSPFG